MLFRSAKVLGSFTIGDNSKIGAGSVVLEEVPPGSTVVGVPGRVVKRNNMALPQEELDQVNLPDPVREDLSVLHHANTRLTNTLIDLDRELREMKHRCGKRQKCQQCPHSEECETRREHENFHK